MQNKKNDKKKKKKTEEQECRQKNKVNWAADTKRAQLKLLEDYLRNKCKTN